MWISYLMRMTSVCRITTSICSFNCWASAFISAIPSICSSHWNIPSILGKKGEKYTMPSLFSFLSSPSPTLSRRPKVTIELFYRHLQCSWTVVHLLHTVPIDLILGCGSSSPSWFLLWYRSSLSYSASSPIRVSRILGSPISDSTGLLSCCWSCFGSVPFGPTSKYTS